MLWIFLSFTSKIISSKTEFADIYESIYNTHLIYLKSLLLNCINMVRDNQDTYTSQIHFTLLSQFGNYFSVSLYSHSKFRSHEQQFGSTGIMQYQVTLDGWGESHSPFFFSVLGCFAILCPFPSRWQERKKGVSTNQGGSWSTLWSSVLISYQAVFTGHARSF